MHTSDHGSRREGMFSPKKETEDPIDHDERNKVTQALRTPMRLLVAVVILITFAYLAYHKIFTDFFVEIGVTPPMVYPLIKPRDSRQEIDTFLPLQSSVFYKPVKTIPDHIVAKRRNDIVKAFTFAYENYEKYAFGSDELMPVSRGRRDTWGGFGATIIDALDTLMVMGLDEHVARAREHIEKIDWQDRDVRLSFFETIIRHVGGLLSAYDLSQDKMYLTKAKELVDSMLFAFDNDARLPPTDIKIKSKQATNPDWRNGNFALSEIGTLQLEFAYLSYHTGDPKYYKIGRDIYTRLHKSHRDLPKKGLYSAFLDNLSGNPIGSKLSFGAFSDSFYEYLFKLYMLTGYQDESVLEMYVESMNAMQDHLLLRVPVKLNETSANRYKVSSTVSSADNGDPSEHIVMVSTIGSASRRQADAFSTMDHLTCFAGGMLGIGAARAASIAASIPGPNAIGPKASPVSNLAWKSLSSSKAFESLIQQAKSHFELAEEITTTCYLSYATSPSGIGPEEYRYKLAPTLPSARKTLSSVHNYGLLNRIRYAQNTDLSAMWSVNRQKAAALSAGESMTSPAYLPEEAKQHNEAGTDSIPAANTSKPQPISQDSLNNWSSYMNLANGEKIVSAETSNLDPSKIKTFEDSFASTMKSYYLRPETIESIFIMYRLTGDDKYREWGWKIFEAIETHCKTKYGYSGLVNAEKSKVAPLRDIERYNLQWNDAMETFLFSETLKYLYLLFSPTDLMPLDKYVFNSEAHPLSIIPPTQSVFKIPTPEGL